LMPTTDRQLSLNALAMCLDGLADQIRDLKSEIDSQNDGPIDRMRLAKLLGIEVQTLKNRASEFPDPIKRGPRGVPIYKYSEVKAAIEVMFPDRAHLLSSYLEAMEISI